jgi:hypothetical protein
LMSRMSLAIAVGEFVFMSKSHAKAQSRHAERKIFASLRLCVKKNCFHPRNLRFSRVSKNFPKVAL